MLRNKAAKPTTIRNHNRNIILQTIEMKGPVYRADLAAMTQMSEPTVSTIIENFLQKKLVRELGLGVSSSGRKPVMIEFNSGAGYVVGIDAGGTNIKIGISDLGGNFILKKRFLSQKIGAGETAIAGLADLTARVIAESKVEPKQVLGVGLSLPGIVDFETGRVTYSPAFQWHEIVVSKMLAPKLDLPVWIENDVNSAALAEKHWGVAKDYQDFVFMSLGTGIGAGLILNGELYRGYQNAAGEVGYTIVDLSWLKRKENPGQLSFGCLESLAAASGIVQCAQRLGFTGRNTALKHPKDLSPKEIFGAAQKGDPIALQVIDEITDYLTAGITNIALIVSPQAVVLGGGIAEAGETLLNPLRQKLDAVSPVKPTILLSAMHADAGLIGSVSLAIHNAKQRLIED